MISLYPSPPPALTAAHAASAVATSTPFNSLTGSSAHVDAYVAALSRQRSSSTSDSLAPPRAKRAKSSDRAAATSASHILGEWCAAYDGSHVLPSWQSAEAVPLPQPLSALSFDPVNESPCAPSFQSHVANVARPINSRSSTAPMHPQCAAADHATTDDSVVSHAAAGLAGILGPQLEAQITPAGTKTVQTTSGLNAPKLSATSSLPDVATKDRFVAGLVGASVLAIESIWGSSPVDTSSPDSGVLPIHWFVKEVLRRSRTSCSTLQLALFYLHKSRRDIRDAVARAAASRQECSKLEQQIKATREARQLDDSYPSPPMSPISDDGSPSNGVIQDRLASLLEFQSSPVLCGRRMFLAALIAASKYLQDRNYSNRAWSRISGLPVNEINSNERAFLTLVGFDLHLGASEFRKWTERLASLTTQGAQIEQAVSQARTGLGLARTQSEYAPNVEQPTHDLMRPARLSLELAGRSQSEATLKFGGQQRQFEPPVQMASPPNSESSGDESYPSIVAGRKVRGLPLRRSQQGLGLSRAASRSSLGAARHVDAIHPSAIARWH
ncbi:PHO85 cyclin-5 [Microbotryomycetes sp. JL201]|nr:PHO85 cyclin-5 [Microbotryomycetes sp. JL201]